MTNRQVKELDTLLARLDMSQVVFSYDHDSDSLLVHLFGRGMPGVSEPVSPDYMLRLDRETGDIIGLHVEHFLSRVVRQHPRMLDLLDLADLRGITLEEVALIRREVAAPLRQATAREIIAEFPTFAAALD